MASHLGSRSPPRRASRTCARATSPTGSRSRSRGSMPGMLDTILNVGLNDTAVVGLATATDNERFAWDSYRRLVQMFGNVASGVSGEKFEDAIAQAKRNEGVQTDNELAVDALKALVDKFKGFYDFPEDP